MSNKTENNIIVLDQPSQYQMMIDKAMSKDFDIDKLIKLGEMQERWEANEARKSYNKAFAEFKAECPTILKTSKGHNYMYADLGLMVEALLPVLSKHGLTHSWSMVQSIDNPIIKVTCCLKHVEGHSECVSMQSHPDTSGSIKGIQGIASTKTYLERYTFTAITGLAVKGMDDDGVNAVAGIKLETISDNQILEIMSFIEENNFSKDRVQKLLKTGNIEKIADIQKRTFNNFFSTLKQMVGDK